MAELVDVADSKSAVREDVRVRVSSPAPWIFNQSIAIIRWIFSHLGVFLLRFIDLELVRWSENNDRKPLLLRGARQVGKTFAVRKLAESFDSYVEINCEELEADCKTIFEKDLKPERIVQELSLLVDITVVPGTTLLFIDEIQVVPRAILALRYFYEKIPQLHVVAAGSLIEFALEKVGLPVGRIDSLYMYPMTWIEFLLANDKKLLYAAIYDHDINKPMPEVAHNQLLKILGAYFALGGMPEVVANWVQHSDALQCFKIQQALINDYKQDFEKYAKKYQIKYVTALFDQVPRQLGQKFKFNEIPGEFRKRDLVPGFELLVKAGILHPIYQTSAQGLPLGADANLDKFKAIFVDIGLSQAILGLDLKQWFLNPGQAFVNQGSIVEAFVGQEMVAYSYVFLKKELYYWHREARTSSAELDYVMQIKQDIIPIEVKSGKTGKIKSLREYLKTHPNTLYSIRFSSYNYSEYEGLRSYPLYAVAKALSLPIKVF